MGIFGKSKRELLEWQNILASTPSNKLVMSEKQLLMASQQAATNHMRILKESVELCNKTKKPDVFFSRYNLIIEHGKKLVDLSKYLKFSGATPQAALNQAIEQRPIGIRQLIDRSFEDAEALKTDSAKKKRYNKILSDFIPYKSEIDEKNWAYLESTCIQKGVEG